jgi:hypothetical protein
LHKVQLMAGEQDDAAGFGPLPQSLGQTRHGKRVEAVEGLVE